MSLPLLGVGGRREKKERGGKERKKERRKEGEAGQEVHQGVKNASQMGLPWLLHGGTV
jgi:hypothetical protein